MRVQDTIADAMKRLRRHNSAIPLCLAVFAILIVTACQPLSNDVIVRSAPLHLLEHKVFLGYDSTDEAPSISPLLADAQMRDFVVPDISEVKSRRFRVHSLMNKLADHGYYQDYYEAGLTIDASQAFTRKRGNCLSYTHMFISLAREAGLDARYELVKAPPLYSVADGILEHQVHIRSRIMWSSEFGKSEINRFWPTQGVARTLAVPRINLERYISVDFNERNIKAYEGRLVSDDFALSLHLANNAVEYWKRRDESKAFTHIVEAIRLSPRYADHWVNLATFYTRRGLLNEALLINRYALSLDPHHVIALAGVVQHAARGEMSRAKSRLHRLRSNNAHYQFALAQRATASQDLPSALSFVDRSIALEKRNHEFLAYKAAVLMSLQRYSEAHASLDRALTYTKEAQKRQEYELKLNEIEQKIVEYESQERALPETRSELTAREGF